MSISLEGNKLITASSSSSNKRPGPLPKLNLKLNIKTIEEKQIVVSQNNTSSYILYTNPPLGELGSAMSSSSKYIHKKIFFDDKKQTKVYQDFSILGNFHYVTQKSNGKEQQDTYTIKTMISKCPGLSFFAVYDGHSTQTIAEMLSQKLDEYIIEVFQRTQDMILAIHEAFSRAEREITQFLAKSESRGGSTALCGIFYKNLLFVANLGDSRAVMFQKNSFVNLSSLHDFSNKEELEFVETRNGVVLNKRLEGELAVSRSFGDLRFKAYMNKEPEIVVHEIQDQDEYLFLATDGYWNGMDPMNTLQGIQSFREGSKGKSQDMKFLGDSLLEDACSNIKTKKDNMTLIIVNIKELQRNQ